MLFELSPNTRNLMGGLELKDVYWTYTLIKTKHSQPAFTCSKLTIKTVGQGVKYETYHVIKKDTVAQ